MYQAPKANAHESLTIDRGTIVQCGMDHTGDDVDPEMDERSDPPAWRKCAVFLLERASESTIESALV